MNLKPLFRPKSLAVAGVSLTNENHPANVVYYKNKLRHKLRVYPVNNKGGALHGDKVYARVLDIPDSIDLAIIAVRAEMVQDVVADCISKGVKGAVIISGGFAESGQKALQDSLVSLARDADFPFIGPNCLGIYSGSYVDTLFVPSERLVKPQGGQIALVSQSGGILVDLMAKFADEDVGLSVGISIGNKAFVRELDLLRYLANDPETGVMAFYIEGFGENEGREFVKAARQCQKPVVVLKSGKSAITRKAISSHTGSMAGDYRVFSAVLAQHGIVEAKDDLELTSFCEVLDSYKKPIKGRIAIITDSGGHGVNAMDFCQSYGLPLTTLTDDDKRAIQEQISPTIRTIASLSNPVDLTGSAVDDDFTAVVRYLSRKEEIDCLLVLLLPYLPGITSDLGAQLSMIYRQEGKPIIAYVPHVEKYQVLIEGFRLNNIPVAQTTKDAALMAKAMKMNQPC